MLYNTDYRQFLLDLDKTKAKTTFARITALKFDETPIETIEGRVTQGSINLDGDSAVRRTCSLTLIADKFDYKNYVWGMNTKFKLEIGLKNTINKNYPDIIWFKQGVYLISSFNTTRSTNNFSITIQGKDKMCQLNGEVGGSLGASIDFGTIEEVTANGDVKIIKLPIPDIIRNIVHQYAGEPMHNIIINDIEDYGLELLEYRYDLPMYLYRETNSSYFMNITLDGNTPCTVTGKANIKCLNDLTSSELDMLVDTMAGTSYPVPVTIDGKDYYVAKVEYGQTAGYRTTELTYPGDLIGAVGEAITSILDKIKNMLGEFEYFYDLDGRFVFQRKQSFINTLWSPSVEQEDGEIYTESLALASSRSYAFTEGELITAFNNNPNIMNMRNDYAIWGERTGITGAKIPVHMRYAIDKKPSYYKTFDGRIYTTDEETFKRILEEKKENIKKEFYEKIDAFKPLYAPPVELEAPERLADYSWTPGWWDIRDWCEYYTLLTDEVPSYSMKWYSQNDETGCIPINTIPGHENRNGYCWLIIRSPSGSYNFQHGSGNPANKGYTCTLYHSYYDETAPKGYVTEQVKDENGQPIKEYYMHPYCGCSDNHTYLEFLEGDVKRDGNQVFFYNPAFPSYESVGDLIEDEIDKEFEEYLKSGLLNFVDWREIIYQMAVDFYANNQKDEFEIMLGNNNDQFYPSGQTGYEQYYIDLLGFWRQLYVPVFAENEQSAVNAVNAALEEYNKWLLEHPTASDAEKTNARKSYDDAYKAAKDLEDKLDYYLLEGRAHWIKNVYEHPEVLNFWFDFLDVEGELSQYSVKNVGPRTKAINDTNIKSIYFRETPSVVFVKEQTDTATMSGYKYIQMPDDSMFTISSQGRSAKDKLDELIYQHGYCTESATITTIPIYYLQPNIRVYVSDKDTNLDGDYIISKITVPLAYNGTMSLTATKAAETLF